MINIAKLLADDNEIRKLVVPKPWKHDYIKGACRCMCVKCEEVGVMDEVGGYVFKNPDCPIPDPIDLDWNLAKKMQAECDQDKFTAALCRIFQSLAEPERGFYEVWIERTAQSKHYITAALVAGEGDI